MRPRHDGQYFAGTLLDRLGGIAAVMIVGAFTMTVCTAALAWMLKP
jgi:hypothetical protein